MSRHLQIALAKAFERQAETRRETALENKHQRSFQAAKCLDELAGQVASGDFAPDNFERYVEIIERVGPIEDVDRRQPKINKIMRDVGFRFFPKNADEFFAELYDRCNAIHTENALKRLGEEAAA